MSECSLNVKLTITRVFISDASFPRLGQMIIDYDVPMKKLSDEFIPHCKVILTYVVLGVCYNDKRTTT